MIIEVIASGPFSTNTYLLGCESTKEAVVIDPSFECLDKLQKLVEKHLLGLKAIYLTHSHWDHIADVSKVKKFYHIPVYVHSLDQPNLIHPGADGLPLMFDIKGVTPDHILQDKDSIFVGDIQGEVMHTPGHSVGSVCFYFPKEKLLISGDTLFKGTIGNTSFPTSNTEDMWKSLKKLSTLPPDTKVMPGHGSPTTIGKEPWLDHAEEIFG